MEKKIKIIFCVGVRPNFVKVAPLLKEIKKNKGIETVLAHTGQHYDKIMSDSFLRIFKMPKPKYYFGVKILDNEQQLKEIQKRAETVYKIEKPDLVIIVGDANSSLACALAAKKTNAKIVHVEAGLRSFDETMPEEKNRIAIDSISDYFFATEKSAIVNLKRSNISKNIHLVGNLMIDSLVSNLKRIESAGILKKLGLNKKSFAILTLHRKENTDNKKKLEKIIKAVDKISEKITVVFPVHPRTRERIKRFEIKTRKIKVIEPLNYLDFLKLVKESRFVMTDSGGLQEETTFLKVPCLTLRKNTERPVTISHGTNILCNSDEKKIMSEALKIMNGRSKKTRTPEYWDGKTAKRIAEILITEVGKVGRVKE